MSRSGRGAVYPSGSNNGPPSPSELPPHDPHTQHPYPRHACPPSHAHSQLRHLSQHVRPHIASCCCSLPSLHLQPPPLLGVGGRLCILSQEVLQALVRQVCVCCTSQVSSHTRRVWTEAWPLNASSTLALLKGVVVSAFYGYEKVFSLFSHWQGTASL